MPPAGGTPPLSARMAAAGVTVIVGDGGGTPRPSRVNDALTPPPFTERQRQCLQLLADGLSVAEIAAHLGLQPHSPKKYLKIVRDQLGVETLHHAVAKAMRAGWIQ